MAFAGMNMANMVGGINAGQLYQMDAQQNGMGMQQAQAAPVQGQAPKMQAPVLGWTCSCGATDNRGKFCWPDITRKLLFTDSFVYIPDYCFNFLCHIRINIISSTHF